jgi:hypothetical protein
MDGVQIYAFIHESDAIFVNLGSYIDLTSSTIIRLDSFSCLSLHLLLCLTDDEGFIHG